MQIAEWKKKHDEIFFTKANGHIAYFRKTTKQELSYAMTLANEPLKMAESRHKACMLGGSDVFIEDIFIHTRFDRTS